MTTATLSPSERTVNPSSAAAPVRILSRSLTLRIVKGQTDTRYCVARLTPDRPDRVKGFLLKKHGSPEAYECWLTELGALTCTCKDFRFNRNPERCKHLDALADIGMLDPDDWRELAALRAQSATPWPRIDQPAVFHGKRVWVRQVFPKLALVEFPGGKLRRVPRAELAPDRDTPETVLEAWLNSDPERRKRLLKLAHRCRRRHADPAVAELRMSEGIQNLVMEQWPFHHEAEHLWSLLVNAALSSVSWSEAARRWLLLVA